MKLYTFDGKWHPLSSLCDGPENKRLKTNEAATSNQPSQVFALLHSLVRTPSPHHASFSGQFYLILHSCFIVRKSHVRLVAQRKTLRPLPHEEWERIPDKCNIFEGMEEEDPKNNCKEPANCSYYAINRHIKPFFEKDGWAGHDRGGEENIIDGSNYRRVKDVERFVQVVNLNTDADHQADDQWPEKRFLQNSCASKQLFDANAQALYTGHGEGANHRADQDVDQHILLSKPRSHSKDKNQAAPHNTHSKHNETCWKNSKMLIQPRTFRLSDPRARIGLLSPGSLSLTAMTLREATSSSWGAWITITVDPRMLSKQPTFPCMFSLSLRKYEESTALEEHKWCTTFITVIQTYVCDVTLEGIPVFSSNTVLIFWPNGNIEKN